MVKVLELKTELLVGMLREEDHDIGVMKNFKVGCFRRNFSGTYYMIDVSQDIWL